MPRIENWSLVGGRIFGIVYNDKLLKDGEAIVTSRIREIDEEKGYARAIIARYKLGKKAEF